MKKILGLDLGTDSIGWAIVRQNDDSSYTLLDKGVNKFEAGVARDHNGHEIPLCQTRRIARGQRRLYARRRTRKIELLKVLIENGMCPHLSSEQLHEWKQFKKYPQSDDFRQWQKTDELSGSNPYHDRYRCLTETLDLANEKDRYALGRALYHICQRRGFFAFTNQEGSFDDEGGDETGKIKAGISKLTDDIKASSCEHLGEYFHALHQQGKKIRGCYTDREKHYKAEFDAICEKQGISPSLKERFERAIFYQRKLKRNAGSIAKCKFEPKKKCCPVGHPRFEEFRMWDFVNRIRVKTDEDPGFRPLTESEVEKILPLFFRASEPQFPFEDIAKKLAGKDNYCHKEDKVLKSYVFNYRTDYTVSGCPFTSALMRIFGKDWLDGMCSQYLLASGKSQEDILNEIMRVMVDFDDKQKLADWLADKLQLERETAMKLADRKPYRRYASLSLNVINKILPYLREGYGYSSAVFLANLPCVMGKAPDDDTLEKIKENVAILLQDNPSARETSLHKSITDYLLSADAPKPHKLYHPSMIDVYPKAMPVNGIYQLGSPRCSAMKNPMSMRALFRLQVLLNELLLSGQIDRNTEIHIEYSRELNDKNKRAAIIAYQKGIEDKRRNAVKRIKEYYPEGYEPTERQILRYVLWEEQKQKCPYTHKTIGIKELLDEKSMFDIEHTIPRARGGDDSQMNKVLCDSKYNRKIKGNQIPSELPDHEAIMQEIKSFGWMDKIASLRRQLKATYNTSKTRSADPGVRDTNMRSRHKLKMELDYIEGKVNRFTMKEVPSGFSNRQGVDVGIISRYAGEYLRTVFDRVYTVKGATTAEFRTMWGLQKSYTQKDRSHHGHHCIDAAVIACIGKREYDLWAQYVADEESCRHKGLKKPSFPKPWTTFVKDMNEMKESILIPHHTPSKFNIPALRKQVIKGVIQTDDSGRPIYTQSDTARCQLHGDTYYKAIMHNGVKCFVTRKKVCDLTVDSLQNIVDDGVRRKILEAVNAKGPKALTETIWLNESANIPINSVTMFAKIKNPLPLRKHRDVSKHEHKQSVYVSNEGNYGIAIYEGTNKKGETVRSCKIISNYEAVRFFSGKADTDSLAPHKDKDGRQLKYILRNKSMVLMWENSPDELYSMDTKKLSKRLYRVKGIGDGRAVFQLHTEARKDINQVSKVDFTVPSPVARLSPNAFNLLVEDIHFTLSETGKIEFIK